MYHQVTPRPRPAFRKYAVTPKAFAAQMRWLDLAGYVPVTLDALLEHRDGRSALPPRPVIITFDDGFQDCFDYAVPVLQERGFTAVFYLVVGLVGGTSRWLLAEKGIELPLMNWGTVRQLEAAGFQFGSHTMNHFRLADLSSGACRDELLKSKFHMEDRLGHSVEHLSYPFGSFNASVRAAAEEAGYRSACSVRIGLLTADDDLLALRRVPVNGQDSLFDFACRLRLAKPLGELLRAKAFAAAYEVWGRMRLRQTTDRGAR